MEATEPKGQPAMATSATKEDTRQQVLTHAKWVQVPDSSPKTASGPLEPNQWSINELTLQLIAHLYEAREPGAKSKSSNSKIDLVYKRAFLQLRVAGVCFVGFLHSYISSTYLV